MRNILSLMPLPQVWRSICAAWRSICAEWRTICAEWRAICAVWRAICAVWRAICAEWRTICAQWRLICAQWRLICAHWRLIYAEAATRCPRAVLGPEERTLVDADLRGVEIESATNYLIAVSFPAALWMTVRRFHLRQDLSVSSHQTRALLFCLNQMKTLLLFLVGLSFQVSAQTAKPGDAPAPVGEIGKPKAKPPVLKNGDFSKVGPANAPEDWKAAYPTGSFAVEKEGNESFLRVEVKGEPANAGVVQTVKIPTGALTAEVRGRMRGKPAKTPKASAQLVFWPKGQLPAAPTIITSEHSVAWKTESREIPIPPGAKTLEVSARCVFATGRFDFDDIEVQFK